MSRKGVWPARFNTDLKSRRMHLPGRYQLWLLKREAKIAFGSLGQEPAGEAYFTSRQRLPKHFMRRWARLIYKNVCPLYYIASPRPVSGSSPSTSPSMSGISGS